MLEYLSARWQDEGMDDKSQKGCRQCGTGSYYVPWKPLDLGAAISALQLPKTMVLGRTLLEDTTLIRPGILDILD